MANFEFKPFDKILVRNCIMGHKAYWIPALYGFKSKDMKHYLTSAGWQEECIPYEGNEEYLGTTKDYVDIIPKFKVGDWICHTVYKKPLLIVEDLGEGDFRTEPKSIITAKEFREGFYRLWTIQDAKDGDVLEFGDHGRLVVGIVSFISKRTGRADVYCLLEANNFKVGNFYALDTINPHPATKEQRDTLMKAMVDAGYTFDFEKKELKKIEQKPAEWSEEDREYMQSLLDIINGTPSLTPSEVECHKDWLKSLKDRFLPQPKQEWSEEDYIRFNSIISTIEYSKEECKNAPAVVEVYDLDLKWLKSLKERYTWKPSEGQMVALNCAITAASDNFVCLNVKDLESLYEDLKKLTE